MRINSNMRTLLDVSLCFLLSGFAALLYQTAWMRQFSVVFGTSELAVAAVLSAYMGGLAFGAAIAARYVHLVKRPVLFYGVLEAGIALSALALPLFLGLAKTLYVMVFGGQPEPVDASGLGQSFFYLAIAFLVLSIPTALMGATLPLLIKYAVKSDAQIGPRVGALYAINTIGAVAGTIVAAFVLLPRYGLNGTVWFGVGINILVFFLAANISRNIKIQNTAAQNDAVATEPAKARSASIPGAKWILPIMLFSGANSFLYEVLWTRLLGHILGGSVTAFATMLAGFLSGIALGSAIAARFAVSPQFAKRAFVVVQLGIAIASALIYELLPMAIPESGGLKGNVLLAILVLLPATLFIGATFPLAVRILATNENQAASSSATIYTWNTVGAICGATLAAFFLIPLLRYEGTVELAVIVNVLLALGAAFLIGRRDLRVLAAGILVTLSVWLIYSPQIPEAVLKTSALYFPRAGELRHYDVGRSSTVIVLEDNGYLNLRNNGLPEASTSLIGAPPVTRYSQKMLSTMPVIARPDTETMLVVGFGGGVTLEDIPPTVDSIDVIELEPAVIEANRTFSEERAIDPFKDPRIKITVNDGRSALALTDKRYDSIVSQPSHPWTAGASHLYTREFMQLAADHLTDDGVYLQWMNSQFIDEFLLQSLCATMLDVFEYVRVYQWDPEVLFFLGSQQPLDVEKQVAETGEPFISNRSHYLYKGMTSLEDVIAALVMDQDNVEQFAKQGKVITDNFNYMATQSTRAMEDYKTLNSYKLPGVLAPFDPLLQPDSEIHTQLSNQIDFRYLAERLQVVGFEDRGIDLGNQLMEEGNAQGIAIVGLDQLKEGNKEESQKNLLLASETDPANQQIRYALVRPWLEDVAAEREVPEHITKALNNIEGLAAAVIQGELAAENKDMAKLKTLDTQLSAARPTDIWYEDAAKLRIDWRIDSMRSEYQPQIAEDTMRLIDEAIAVYQEPAFYAQRLIVTRLGRDSVSSVETARRLVNFFEWEVYQAESGDIDMDDTDIETRLSQLETTQLAVKDAADKNDVPEYKMEGLEDLMLDVKDRLLRL